MTRCARLFGYLAAALLIQIVLFGLGALVFDHDAFGWVAGSATVLLALVIAGDIARDLHERAARRRDGAS